MSQLTAELLAAHWRQHHVRMVRQVRWRVAGRRADAEDLVAEAYARAWRARDRWMPQAGHEDPLTAWIERITTNLVKDRGRRPWRTVLSIDAPALSGEDVIGPWLVDVAASDALDAVISRIDAQALAPTLLAACGSTEQREAVIATHMLSQSHTETAKQLVLTVGMVKSRVFRGVRAMRAAYAELDQGGA